MHNSTTAHLHTSLLLLQPSNLIADQHCFSAGYGLTRHVELNPIRPFAGCCSRTRASVTTPHGMTSCFVLVYPALGLACPMGARILSADKVALTQRLATGTSVWVLSWLEYAGCFFTQTEPLSDATSAISCSNHDGIDSTPFPLLIVMMV